MIIEGRYVRDKIHAHIIPKDIEIANPAIWGIGEKIIDRKAIAVVIDVRKIGIDNALIVSDSASPSFTETPFSFIYLDTICTPSEFAIVRRIIGIEVWIILKLKICLPVM